MAALKKAGLVVLALFVAGCARRVPLPVEKIEAGSRIWVRTTDGRAVAGDVLQRQPDRFVLKTRDGRIDTLLVADVGIVKARPQEYDEAGRLIPESQIDSVKSSKNLVLYTIGGTALSFGASFYLGNFLKRHVSSGQDAVMWGTTGLGTAVGMVAFANAGARRDRLLAVEKIKDYRKKLAEQKLQQEESRKERLRKELERLKKEKAEKEKELERLKKALEQKSEPGKP